MPDEASRWEEINFCFIFPDDIWTTRILLASLFALTEFHCRMKFFVTAGVFKFIYLFFVYSAWDLRSCFACLLVALSFLGGFVFLGASGQLSAEKMCYCGNASLRASLLFIFYFRMTSL